MISDGRPPLAAIFGCTGLDLTDAERAFFARANPLGFIVFARNIDTPDQVHALIDDLRASVGRADAPVLVDQEGGRVQRLALPHWRDAPAAQRFVALHDHDPRNATEAAYLNAQLMADDLIAVGIDVDCAPVLDVPHPGAHDIIGDRAHGRDPETVIALGRAVVDGLRSMGVQPVAKHIPGHGRATADSHEALPVVETERQYLESVDFAPFAALADAGWGMTAHVVYSVLDADRPATISQTVVTDVIRGAIGFDGVLVTDDLSMKALGGSFEDRARLSLEAGCDVVLHCNGDMEEMTAVAAAARPLSDAALDRLARAQAALATDAEFDRWAAEIRLDAIMNGAG